LPAAALFIFIFLPGSGLRDYYLARLSFAETDWPGNPTLALGSIIASLCEKHRILHALLPHRARGIPQELLDMAKIDGAGPWQRFLRITLPLLGPTLAFLLVIAVLNVLTQVNHVIVMTQGGRRMPHRCCSTTSTSRRRQNYAIGLASAATVVSVGFLFALSIVSLRTGARDPL
jgi:sn-glycerol 3-phosphate transport system permease protein